MIRESKQKGGGKMEQRKISTRLQDNIDFFQNSFTNAMDFMTREMDLGGVRAALFGLDGLVSKQSITLGILNPLMGTAVKGDADKRLTQIEETVLGTMEQKREQNLDTILTLLMSGFAVLCVDGCGEAIVFGVQGFDSRGPEEPQNEVMQRGAKDGFTES